MSGVADQVRQRLHLAWLALRGEARTRLETLTATAFADGYRAGRWDAEFALIADPEHVSFAQLRSLDVG